MSPWFGKHLQTFSFATTIINILRSSSLWPSLVQTCKQTARPLPLLTPLSQQASWQSWSHWRHKPEKLSIVLFPYLSSRRQISCLFKTWDIVKDESTGRETVKIWRWEKTYENSGRPWATAVSEAPPKCCKDLHLNERRTQLERWSQKCWWWASCNDRSHLSSPPAPCWPRLWGRAPARWRWTRRAPRANQPAGELLNIAKGTTDPRHWVLWLNIWHL